jgi:hypothetical protein
MIEDYSSDVQVHGRFLLNIRESLSSILSQLKTEPKSHSAIQQYTEQL